MPKYSSNQPDLTDIEMAMRALEAAHGGQVQLTVTPAGIAGSGGLVSVLSYLSPTPDAGTFFTDLVVTARWPCPHHREYWPCIFDGLYRLDAKVERAYGQKPLPEG